MKNLLKIYGKYIGFTWLIILLLAVVNMGVLFLILLNNVLNRESAFPKGFRNLDSVIFEENTGDEAVLSRQGIQYIKERGYEFLMVLDDNGDVICSWNLPEGFEDHYTLGEVAAFTRWYLHDYPVKVWRTEKGLLVGGRQKNSIWKYTVEFSIDFMEHLGDYIRIVLVVNLLIILCVVGCLGYRYYKSLRPLSEGIDALSQNRPIHLAERGNASQIARQINQTSNILKRQRQAISRRDTARTEWIAGVSHDIRTPLSVIIGYADELEQNGELGEEERARAAVIRTQSLKIRQLIEDLNLTSKLEYHMQPLRITPFYPAALLRELAAEVINEGLGRQYELAVKIEPELAGVLLKGDKELIARAVRNLLNNSIRHNPAGCRIGIGGGREMDRCVLEITDDGCGIPDAVIRCLYEESKDTDQFGEAGERGSDSGRGARQNEKKPHIMGLRIAKQIVLAHKGDFQITEGGHCVRMSFPVD